MEGRRKAIESLLDRLKQHGAKLMGLELGAPMAAGLPDLLVTLGGAKAPPELVDLYIEIDGAAVMWNLQRPDGVLAGGFNLQSIGVAMARNGADDDSAPLEGILWTGDEAPETLAILKALVAFDSVPGRNDFICVGIDDPCIIYLVEDGVPRRIHATLDETLDAIIAYGGADSLRAHLVHDDWASRIDRDPALRQIAAL